MSEHGSWFKKLLGADDMTTELRKQLEALEQLLNERDHKIAVQAERLLELEEMSQHAVARMTGLAERAQAQAHRLAQVEQSRSALELSLLEADERQAKLQRKLRAEQERAESAAEASADSERRSRNLASCVRKQEKELVTLQSEVGVATQNWRDLQAALSKATYEREQLGLQNKRLTAQLRVLESDSARLASDEDGVVSQSRRVADAGARLAVALEQLSSLEAELQRSQQNARRLSQEVATGQSALEAIRADVRGLLVSAVSGLWAASGGAATLALALAPLDAAPWLRDRLALCRGPGEVVATLNEVLSGLGLVELQLLKEVPIGLLVKTKGPRDGDVNESLAHWAAGLVGQAFASMLTSPVHIVPGASDAAATRFQLVPSYLANNRGSAAASAERVG